MSRTTTVFLVLVCAGPLAVSPTVATAQHAAASSVAGKSVSGKSAAAATAAYDRELRSYTLTMDNLRKLKQTGLALAAYAKAHPDAQQQWGDIDDGNGSVADQAHRMDAIPPARQALAAAGLTSRDYLLTSMAFFQAGMAAAIQDSYEKTKQKPPALPNNVNPANVSFVRSHKAEIEQLKLGELMNSDSSGKQ